MKYAFRMTSAQHQELRSHLFPGDGNEAVALLLCGRRSGQDRHIFTVRKSVLIPHDLCKRFPDRITWPTSFVDELWKKAREEHLGIAKIHSLTPRSTVAFPPPMMLRIRRCLPRSIAYLMTGSPTRVSSCFQTASCSAECSAKTVRSSHASLRSLLWEMSCRFGTITGLPLKMPSLFATLRHLAAERPSCLRRLSIAIIGCSGTGSIVAEQLARLGVGRLILVDPDFVEEGRISIGY